MTSSYKRQKPTPVDDDTRVVKHRCTGARLTPTSADTSQDYCNSPPAAQELPWGPLFEDVSDDDDDDDDVIASSPAHDDDEEAIASSPAHEADDDDDDFTFSPASPPLTQRTEDERTTTVSPPMLYVFPDETVVLTPDGGCVRIPDQHTITHPKPSTIEDDDDADDDEDEPADDPRKVCFLKMQTNMARLITHQWRASAPSTVEEVTVDVCRSLAVTVLSAAYQDILMKYVRCNIRRQPNSSM